jgi:DNA-binding response OmpR family regulator
MEGVSKTREPWRVLVVEDDPDLRKLIVRMLEQNEFEVLAANDGRMGLALAFGERRPHLIITDIMMPNMDGLQMVKQIRQDKTAKAPPVIFLTAKGAPKDVIAGIGAGARHYLVKPFSVNDLIDKVRAILPAVPD